jgi:hypothetical protein
MIELESELKSLAELQDFQKYPILARLFEKMEQEGAVGARPCEHGVELRFLNKIRQTPNRAYLRIYFPTPSKCVLFYHKKSSVPFSHERFSYGGIVVDVRSLLRFDLQDVDEWVQFLKGGLNPAQRPKSIKKSIPYTIPED